MDYTGCHAISISNQLIHRYAGMDEGMYRFVRLKSKKKSKESSV
jgi:hypothetical protein